MNIFKRMCKNVYDLYLFGTIIPDADVADAETTTAEVTETTAPVDNAEDVIKTVVEDTLKAAVETAVSDTVEVKKEEPVAVVKEETKAVEKEPVKVTGTIMKDPDGCWTITVNPNNLTDEKFETKLNNILGELGKQFKNFDETKSNVKGLSRKIERVLTGENGHLFRDYTVDAKSYDADINQLLVGTNMTREFLSELIASDPEALAVVLRTIITSTVRKLSEGFEIISSMTSVTRIGFLVRCQQTLRATASYIKTTFPECTLACNK